MSEGGGPSAAGSTSLLKKPVRAELGGVSSRIPLALITTRTVGCKVHGTSPWMCLCPDASELRVIFPVFNIFCAGPVELCLYFAFMGGALTW